MDKSQFTEEMQRHLAKVGDYWAFFPPNLPPAISWNMELSRVQSDAEFALGELAGLGRSIHNPRLLIRPFMHREAVLSSQIEGTQASPSDLALFEINPKIERTVPDVREVGNYVRAMEYGLERLREIPISRRLICELHAKLMDSVRGQNRDPGHIRRIQVHIGAPGSPIDMATFVPPPPGPELERALDALEKYLHVANDLPPLIRLAAVHYQFEAIHPFLDGNGRIGRLLLPLLLCAERRLPQPLLYLSAYFEKHRQRYYDLLLQVSLRNAWHDWIIFFLRGVALEASDAAKRAQLLLALQKNYETKMGTRQTSALTLRLVANLFVHPATTVGRTAQTLGITAVAAQRHVDRLVKAKILTEITGNQRNRIYLAKGILAALEQPLEADSPA